MYDLKRGEYGGYANSKNNSSTNTYSNPSRYLIKLVLMWISIWWLLANANADIEEMSFEEYQNLVNPKQFNYLINGNVDDYESQLERHEKLSNSVDKKSKLNGLVDPSNALLGWLPHSLNVKSDSKDHIYKVSQNAASGTKKANSDALTPSKNATKPAISYRNGSIEDKQL